jgi:hypothetical protein
LVGDRFAALDVASISIIRAAGACWTEANQRLSALAGDLPADSLTEINRRASLKKQKAPSLPLEDLLNSIGALPPI